MDTFHSFLISNLILVALLSIVVLGITKVWRNPHLAFWLWLLVLIKLITPPLLVVELPAIRKSVDLPVSSIAVAAESVDTTPVVVTEVSAPAAAEPLIQLETCMLAIWVLGVLVLGLIAFSRMRQLSIVLQQSRRADRRLEDEARLVAEQMGLKASPPVRLTGGRLPPLVTAGFKSQTILLPEQLVREFDTDQLRSVLAHELAHVRRGDRWVRLFEVFVVIAFWWNPFAWLASRRLRQAAEECCDAMVIWAQPDRRRSYGSALLQTVEFSSQSEQPISGVAFGEPLFKQRIRNIMKNETHHQMSIPARLAVILAALIVLPFATIAESKVGEKPKPAKLPALFPLDDKPIAWKRMTFTLGEEPEAEREFIEKLAKRKLKSLHEVNLFFKQQNVVVMSIATEDLEGAPRGDEFADFVGDLKVGEVTAPIKVGNRYHLIIRELDVKLMKENREHAAQLRLLRLDVKAAKIRAAAAREKASLLEELAAEKKVAEIEARGAGRDADLADIAVERAEVAVELCIAKHENRKE